MEVLFWAVIGIAVIWLMLVVPMYLSIGITIEEIIACDDDKVPEAAATQLLSGEKIIQKLGFELHHTQKALQLLNAKSIEQWQRVYYHHTERIYAVVSTTFNAKNQSGFEINFKTIYDFPQMLMSVNNFKYLLHHNIDGLWIEDLYTDSFEQMYEHHLDVQRKIEMTPKVFDPAHYIEHDQRWSVYLMQEAVKNRDMRGKEEGVYRFTFIGVLRMMVRKLLFGSKAARNQKSIASALDEKNDTSQSDLQLYHTQKAAQDSSFGALGKTALFVSSLLLFSLALGFILSVQTLVIIVVVLLFHEGGHIAAMYLLGYRDLQILFLPFVGAVATSKQPESSAIKGFIVSLMGPLPGIVLGLVLLMYGDPLWPEWVSELTYMLLFLNLFNLLPIMPLDGGQIINQLLFFRHPRLQVLFVSLSALAFVSVAFLFGDVVAWLIAAVMLWLAYDTFGKAMFRRAFFKQVPDESSLEEGHYLNEIFSFFQKEKYRKFAFNKKFAYAEHLLNQRRFKTVRISMASLLLTLYVATLFAPPFLIAKHFLSRPPEMALIKTEEVYMLELLERAAMWDAEIEAQHDTGERWDTMMQAVAEFEYDDLNRSLYYCDGALNLARKTWPEGNQTVESLQRCAEVVQMGADVSVEPYYFELLQILKEQSSPDKIELASVYRELAMSDYHQTLDQKYLEWQQAYLQLLENDPNADRSSIAYAYSTLSWMRVQRDDLYKAETDLQKAYSIAKDASDPYTLMSISEQLVHFYLETQRYTDALLIAEQLIPPEKNEYSSREESDQKTLKGWVYLLNGQPQNARSAFESALVLVEQQIETISSEIFFLSWFIDTDNYRLETILLAPLQDMMVIESRLDHQDKAREYFERFKIIIRQMDEYPSVDEFLKTNESCAEDRKLSYYDIMTRERSSTVRTLYFKQEKQ